MERNCIAIVNDSNRAVFVKDDAGWRPDWFYENDRAMLRFKDHEWLSLGHVKPLHAEVAEELKNGGYIFRGGTRYGSTMVAWSITVCPDVETSGFLVECRFTPERSIELLEAYTTFETPYDYDGKETVTTVIGMNPVVQWKGAERISPPVWQHPAWLYSRPQSVRCTAPCNAPFLCQSIEAAGDIADRYITVAADWSVCRVHDMYMCPTRTTPHAPATIWANPAEKRGYKYIAGALNWSSAFVKDPNVFYAGGNEHIQRVVIDFSSSMPGRTHDEMLLRAWRRTALFDIPADGNIAAFERVTERGVSWSSAASWLRDVYVSEKTTEGLYKPDQGICTYAQGSRPKAGGDYTWQWWTQWAGPLHYRAQLTGDKALHEACTRNDEHFAKAAHRMQFFNGIAASVAMLPTVWWVHGGGRQSALFEALRPLLQKTLALSCSENGRERAMDYGSQSAIAEALLLGSQAYDSAAMQTQAHVLLDELDVRLDSEFWAFNCGKTGSLEHGGQVRSMGHGHAIMANLLAARQTGDKRFLRQAHRFARYLIAISYASHNGSADPDFDWRGWCNGSNAGRDQIAEFPPWESQNGLLCISALMNDTELEDSFHDALWYIARTGLAQFPAARGFKRILDESMQVRYIARDQLASERDFYDVLPYLAYENPHDQTMLASYQGSDCIVGSLVFGGCIAKAADNRLGVVVPRAATLDLIEMEERKMLLWNPTCSTISTQLHVCWPDASITQKSVTVPSRQTLDITISRSKTS